jgi:hypothetical protein
LTLFRNVSGLQGRVQSGWLLRAWGEKGWKMAENREKEKVGMGQKVAFGLMMAGAAVLYYLVFLNWVLMEPVQNLAYPY